MPADLLPVADRPPAAGDDHRRPVAAGSVAVACALLLVGTTCCWLLARRPWGLSELYFLVDFTDCAVYGMVAALVLWRRGHPVAWLLAATGVGGGLSAFGAQWVALLRVHPALPDPVWLTSARHWAWAPGMLSLIVVLPWLVREGRLPVPARLAVAVGALVVATIEVCQLTWPGRPGQPSGAPLPIPSATWAELIERAEPLLFATVPLLGLVAAAGVGRRWRTGVPRERVGLGWLAVGTVLLALSFAPVGFGPDASRRIPEWLAPAAMLASQAFFPAAVLAVVLRQRLWGIEMAVRRTLVWFLLTFLLVAAYVSGVTVLDAALPTSSAVPGVLVTALVAAGVHPARSRVQRGVDRLIHGEAVEPLGVVRGVGDRISASDDPVEVLTAVAQSLTDLLRLGGCGIEVDGPESCAGRWDAAGPRGEPLVLPLRRADTEIGRLVAWARAGERLDGRTRAALLDLVPLVSSAASLAATSRALAGSRSRLAEAREEERRALRRDLHDGLGPALAGVALGLQAARNLLTVDPPAAGRLLDLLRAEADQRVEQIRDIARALLPPVLGERGLVPALHELAQRYEPSGLTVRVEAVPLPLPEPVATAIYGIVAEAVRNVHRHSGAATCAVSLVRGADGLTVRVTDAGRGVPPDAPAGVGMRSMRERAEGIGGVCVVGPGRDGGTAVTVRLPAERLPARAGAPVVPGQAPPPAVLAAVDPAASAAQPAVVGP
ncbi:sensor histidine kinase [Micromonospora mirobrigensis]|uniref:histidine kinase n=1 Tax=Micromonospora mirobrigensis TaxID=262898 RepID=A0A1C5AHA8_9ACTN|nr:histidine kinase [Micromonospora mirobrigensis]SCF44608.1 Histidine kinase-, DNA gyrase B-, and HSP90-like ATPase [Micromonospora mirobrigensis]